MRGIGARNRDFSSAPCAHYVQAPATQAKERNSHITLGCHFASCNICIGSMSVEEFPTRVGPKTLAKLLDDILHSVQWATLKRNREINRPYSSCPKPLFQSEAMSETVFFFLMHMKLNITRKVLHLTSVWKWGFLELRNGILRQNKSGCEKMLERVEGSPWNIDIQHTLTLFCLRT